MSRIKMILGASLLPVMMVYSQTAPSPPLPPPPPPGELNTFVTATPAMPLMPAIATYSFVRKADIEPIKNAPYSATTEFESVQTLGDGNVIRHNDTGTISRDSQGRTRREQQFPNMGPWSTGQTPKSVIFISDPVNHVSYTLHPDQKKAIKLAMPTHPPDIAMRKGAVVRKGAMTAGIASSAGQVSVEAGSDGPKGDVVFFSHTIAGSALQGASKWQTQQEDLGVQTMEGVQVKGTRVKTTIPAGAIGNDRPIETVSETWYSPELKTEILSKRNDPRMGETTFRLKNVLRVEPSPTLFEVPPDYTVEEPKHFAKKLHKD